MGQGQTVNTILAGIVGSTAYGLTTPTSDQDTLGVFLAPTSLLLGLRPVKETITSRNPDVALHELGKFCGLALKSNPTVTELLWLDEYTVTSDIGQELVAHRDRFLSAGRVRAAYFGYAIQQRRLLEGTKTPSAKHARHLWRLVVQGFRLYRDGELRVRLDADQAADCRDFGERIADGNTDLAPALLGRYEQLFNETRSPLPEYPQTEAVDSWLRRWRASVLTTEVMTNGVASWDDHSHLHG